MEHVLSILYESEVAFDTLEKLISIHLGRDGSISDDMHGRGGNHSAPSEQGKAWML